MIRSVGNVAKRKALLERYCQDELVTAREIVSYAYLWYRQERARTLRNKYNLLLQKHLDELNDRERIRKFRHQLADL